MSSRRTVNRKPKKKKKIKHWDFCNVTDMNLNDNVLFTVDDFPKSLFVRDISELVDGQLVFFPNYAEMGVYAFHHSDTVDYDGSPYSLYRNCQSIPLKPMYFPMVKIPNGVIDFHKTWEGYDPTRPFDYIDGFSWHCISDDLPPHPQLNQEMYNKIIKEENVK